MRVSRSGGPFLLEQTVSRPEVWIPAEAGEVIRMEVTPFDSYGWEGGSYPIPSPVIILDPADDLDRDGLDNGADPCPVHASAGRDADVGPGSAPSNRPTTPVPLTPVRTLKSQPLK